MRQSYDSGDPEPEPDDEPQAQAGYLLIAIRMDIIHLILIFNAALKKIIRLY